MAHEIIIPEKNLPKFRKSIQNNLTLASSPDDIKNEYLRLWAEFKKHRGWACYEIGNVMLVLDTLYTELTGKGLSKYRRNAR